MKRPSVTEQVRKTGAPEKSGLAKLIRENQDFELLHPEELADSYPVPLWLRVVWRKNHPDIQMPAKNPGAAYPEILSQVYKRMVANPEHDWGSGAPPVQPAPPPKSTPSAPKPPAKRKSPRRKA